MERYKLEIVNNHGDRYVRCEPAPDGSWVMFKDVKPLQARIAEIAAKDARIAELEGAVKRAAECIDADDAIGAHGVLAATMEKTSPRNPKWICPINHSGCVKNCGSYGCGN